MKIFILRTKNGDKDHLAAEDSLADHENDLKDDSDARYKKENT